ncbi:hypothetical protein [Dietzia sp. ANT_WB102]|uniref:hypothetical protein n=1 Tax=Dietzia sp. ANT_WB102 TaxID=2597345 RepID=UPI0011F00AF7|nr:hypothetical protein [Dietzia sp. ANT_WB102]KAA0918730.1 hypothetical protein FQ137_05245 [Dietzia sp. ANT_WB102]
MLLKRAAAIVASAAMPLAATVALAPTAIAQETPTGPSPVAVSYTCTPDAAQNIGAQGAWVNEVEVSYPETVAPGEFFSVSIHPGEMKPNQTRTGRVTYDITVPENADYLSYEISGQAAGFNSGTAQLTALDPTTVRLWGGTSPQNGTSTNSGLAKTSSAVFRLPEVTFTMRAPSTSDTEITFDLGQFLYTRGTSNTGTAVTCTPTNPDGLDTLTSTTVSDEPWVPFEWETDLTVKAQVGTLGETTAPVSVVTSFERPAKDLPEGTKIRILRDGEEIDEIEVPETGNSVTIEDEVTRAPTNKVYRYTAEIVETTDEVGDSWSGRTAAAAPIIVTGTGSGEAPDGSGSLDSGSVGIGSLVDPIDSAIAGSLTSSLSGSAGYDLAPLSSPTVTGLLSSAS